MNSSIQNAIPGPIAGCFPLDCYYCDNERFVADRDGYNVPCTACGIEGPIPEDLLEENEQRGRELIQEHNKRMAQLEA